MLALHRSCELAYDDNPPPPRPPHHFNTRVPPDLHAAVLTYNPPNDFLARFYCLLYVTWCNYRTDITRQPPSASIFVLRLFPSKRNKASRKKAAREFQLFIFIYMEEKQTRFVELSESESESERSVPESIQKSQQNMLSTSLKMKKVRRRLSDLVLRKLKLSQFILRCVY